MSNNDYGYATIAAGSPSERKIAIIDFIQAVFLDNRVVSISSLENNEGYILAVENVKSSGREPMASMWLSEESFMGLFGAAVIFWNCKGVDLEKMMEKSAVNNEVKYRISDNLKDFQNADK